MTYAECMQSQSKEAKRVREILKRQKNVKFPEDTILYQIIKEGEKQPTPMPPGSRKEQGSGFID